jgi:SAM-dependent methyltransferase
MPEPAEDYKVWNDLSDILVCPKCKGHLTQGGQTLTCPSCRTSYPIVDGIPRFVPEQDYVGTFGFQWTKHALTQLDRNGANYSEKNFREILGIEPVKVNGKLVLDAGCGMGRYAELASRYGGRVIGIDLSRAVESARANLRDRSNVQIIQGDLMNLPFGAETFDFIYSIGVLHHTPNCELAFRKLTRTLKPGGRIVVWLYSGYSPLGYRMSNIYRIVTTKLPNRALYALCYIAVPLGWLDQFLRKLHLSLLARMIRVLIPFSPHENWRWRLLDTFDWYSPRYQSKHTYEEVFQWFESEGLVNVRILKSSIGLEGQKSVPSVSG